MPEPLPRRFAGRVALITGGASGLGQAAAKRLAQEGAAVALLDLDLAAAERAAAELPGAVALEVDTREQSSVRRAFELAAEALGRIDVVFNNAGVVGPQTPLHETSDEAWQAVMSVNADGAFHVLRAALSALLGHGGAIVNSASSTGLAGKPNLSPYTFSKAGLIGLTRSAAIEYARHGIRVNAIAPTAVMTKLVRDHIARAPDPAAMQATVESQTPIPGLPEPADVAAAVAFLASDDARWITGHTLPIDGGFHAQ
jgi:NAD(P)-dependent dehydrogenase (short-subunit alcohol dehydrogenase family)